MVLHAVPTVAWRIVSWLLVQDSQARADPKAGVVFKKFAAGWVIVQRMRYMLCNLIIVEVNTQNPVTVNTKGIECTFEMIKFCVEIS